MNLGQHFCRTVEKRKDNKSESRDMMSTNHCAESHNQEGGGEKKNTNAAKRAKKRETAAQQH